MKSFFHTLKVELVNQCKWATREEAKRHLFQYIEGVVELPMPRMGGSPPYNRVRIHSALGYKTPKQAERLMA